MFIRNGQASQSSQTSDVLDISELNPVIKTEETVSKIKAKKRKRKFNDATQGKTSRFTEYLSGRKYYILALSFVYIAGMIIGAVLVKNLGGKETFNLCSAIDDYFSGVSSIDMTARILGGIALNLVFLFGIYLCGATVFAPFLCSAFCLYKGLSIGFIIGVYITGGSTLFHLGVCAVNFILYLLTMIFFILACGEAMSFSSFLFKSEESFKNNMSFKNITVYSSRYLLFLILISMSVIVHTIIMPLVYAFFN